MYRTTNLLAGLVFAIAPLALAQQVAAPQVPEDALQPRELIAWSSLQRPQPVPQPMPSPDSAVPEPGQPRDQQVQPPADPNLEQAPLQSFSGVVVNCEGHYALATTEGTFKLDAPAQIDTFTNRNVTITGVLDRENNSIRIAAIQPNS